VIPPPPGGDEQLVVRTAESVLPTARGTFRVIGYRGRSDEAHMAMVLGTVDTGEPVLVRVHSECLTGDVFGSLRCDCQAQLHTALAVIGEAGRGVVVYLRQEGRGIGLLAKLRAYALQDAGLDTVQANEQLGLPADTRDHRVGASILADLGVRRVRVLGNNPQKDGALRAAGIEVAELVPLTTVPTRHNIRYLRTKRDKLGHRLDGLESMEVERRAGDGIA